MSMFDLLIPSSLYEAAKRWIYRWKMKGQANTSYREMIEGAMVRMLNEVFQNDHDTIPTIKVIITSTKNG